MDFFIAFTRAHTYTHREREKEKTHASFFAQTTPANLHGRAQGVYLVPPKPPKRVPDSVLTTTRLTEEQKSPVRLAHTQTAPGFPIFREYFIKGWLGERISTIKNKSEGFDRRLCSQKGRGKNGYQNKRTTTMPLNSFGFVWMENMTATRPEFFLPSFFFAIENCVSQGLATGMDAREEDFGIRCSLSLSLSFSLCVYLIALEATCCRRKRHRTEVLE